MATGATIPILSSTSKPVIGIIGDVRDASTSQRCTAVDYPEILRLTRLITASYFVTVPHHYYTDNVRIWHTRTNVTCDVVMWLESDQRTLMESTPARGACPFPESLIPALVEGALSALYKGQFNMDQADKHLARRNQLLQEAGMRTDVQQRIATS